jgi:hypothetical protein
MANKKTDNPRNIYVTAMVSQKTFDKIEKERKGTPRSTFIRELIEGVL